MEGIDATPFNRLIVSDGIAHDNGIREFHMDATAAGSRILLKDAIPDEWTTVSHEDGTSLLGVAVPDRDTFQDEYGFAFVAQPRGLDWI